MCGIIGNISKNKSIGETQLKNLISLSKQMQFRGPDVFDYYLNDNKKVYLGHLRLSIIDLSNNANQPMESKSKRYVIIFNGEIYNFKELAKNIPNLENSFLQSDTRVLIEYIDHFGIDKALSDINGMYAISVYDKKKFASFSKRFFWKKTIIFFYTSNLICFSSTLKPLIKNENIKKKLA